MRSIFARRHPAGMNEPLGAAADRAVSARTRTSPGAGAGTASARNSARPGPTYQRALASIASLPPRPTRIGFAPASAISLNRQEGHGKAPHARTPLRARLLLTGAPALSLPHGRSYFSPLVALSMAGLIWLAVVALSPGGFGVVDLAAGRAVRGDAAVVRDRLLERDHRPPDHALRARSGRGGHAGGRARARRRADHRLDRDRRVHPQRDPRAGAPASDAADGGDRRARRGAALSRLHPERHQRPGDCGRRGRAIRRTRGRLARPLRRHLSAPHAEHRLQGRQHPRLLRALGHGPRLRARARRRQRDDGGRGAAAGAHHAGRSAHRHPAEPGHRHAVDQRLCAHLPVRHAARHALLHDRQRLVAGRLRALLGPQRASCGSRRSWRIAICRCSTRAR